MHRLMTESVTLNTLSDHKWFLYWDTVLCCISVNFESFGKHFFGLGKQTKFVTWEVMGNNFNFFYFLPYRQFLWKN